MAIRSEYPRPQFKRDEWQTLNGEWEFCYDDARIGEVKGYDTGKYPLDKKIIVPFTYQYPASGIGDKTVHETVWYRRKFTVDKQNLEKSALLCFNGADYKTDVWVNGKHAITHEGGFAPFNVDITPYLTQNGENVLVVKCFDPQDPTIPRGKQSWTGEPFACWYVANTGIWQSVWIEYFGTDAISSYAIVPNIDNCSFSGEITTYYGVADQIEITVSFKQKTVKKVFVCADGKHTRYTVNLMEQDFVDENYYWTPERPNLFYVDFVLYKNGESQDTAHTRFGMRKIHIDESGNVCLNNRKLYQRLILDQGYWVEGGLTAPSVEDIKNDVILAKQMGFNGARKHQKFEDPYFYYYAEELGYLTWCEMPSAYNYNASEVFAQSKEWQEIVNVAKNFTSVICYVPLNESWGVRKILTDGVQQNYARALYYLTKSLDGTRLVSTNDGWENLDVTDLISIHDYAYDSRDFAKKYVAEKYGEIYPQGRKLMCEGCQYYGQPVLFTEFGGIAMQKNTQNGNWGYGESAQNDDEFFIRLQNLIDGVYERDFQGAGAAVIVVAAVLSVFAVPRIRKV